MVRIRLFGGVSATRDGEPVTVGSSRSQTVLAALALSPRTALPVSRLVDLVWGEEPPRTAEKTLQWHVAQLRKGLGNDAIVRAGAAYRLDVDPDAVDVARFQRRLDAGDVEAALAEWTGPPLAGLDAPGLAATVDGLVERWLGAVETDLERRVESDPPSAIAPLTELSAQHPFREGLWALLMTALYRVGRQADALATYQRARRLLVEQLGVEPGARLRDLEALVLDHDEGLSGRGRIATGEDRRGNLPHRMGRLIGRAEDLQVVAGALSRSPVVTLVGPGGIGKTRLALEAAGIAAATQECGAWLIELAEIYSPDDVTQAVADTLAITTHPGRTLTESIITVLRSRPGILVMDNCEHVLDGAAPLVEAIAGRCPDVRLLATSRERLGFSDEVVVTVGPLEPAGAGAELFRERARAVDRTFDPNAHRGDIEEICRRLDGIPLAIELAAARIRSLAPPDLLVRLDDRLRLLSGRRTAKRQQTMRTTIQWSYDLLTKPEQTLFQRLSVFPGPFDLTAADAVGADPSLDGFDVDDLVGRLVEQSMLVVESGPFGRRLRLMETLRQFAAEELRQRGQSESVADRHALWCRHEVSRIHGLLSGPGEIEGVARLGELWPNLRAAVDRAWASGDRALADALVRPVATEIALRGRHEIADWAEHMLALTPPEELDGRAFWLLWVAERHQQDGNHEAYERLADRYGEPDHPLARYARAYVVGDSDALLRHLPDVVDRLRRHHLDELAGVLEAMSAGNLLGAGRFDLVDASVSALADRYRATGPPTLLHWTLQILGYSASFQGRSGRAEELFEQSVGVDIPAGTLSANKLLEARVAFRHGHRSEALATLRSYIDELFETGNTVAASVVSVEFINLMVQLDLVAEAARMLGYLEAINEFGALAARTLVADAGRAIAAGSATDAQAAGARLDDRQALTYMRDVLDQLMRGGRYP